MHLPDGMVSMPVNTVTLAASTAVCAIALVRARKTLGERQAPLLGVTGAFIFAAQMLNFPVGLGTSGHFMGGVLAALLLGPLNGVLVMALVLAVQCLLFADGGLTALGSNVLNMGVIGALGGYFLFRLARPVLPRTRNGFLAAAAFAAWASIVLAAAACAVEVALSNTLRLGLVLPAMTGVHVLIGAGEALITVITLKTVLAARPDLVAAWRPTEGLPQTVEDPA